MISVSDDTRASLVDYAADGGELVADPELSDGNRERVAQLLQMIAATHEFQRA